MKKKLLILAAAAALVVAGFVGFLLTIDVNQFRGRIQAELQKQVGRPVTLGEMGLKILPLSVRVSDITIGESAAFPTGRPFLAAKELRVRIGLLPLLHKEVEVLSIVLGQPSIELVRNAAGDWNFSDLSGKKGGSQSGGGGGSVGIHNLEIDDGALAVSNLTAPADRSVYDHIDLKLIDFVPGSNFRLDAGARLPGSGRNSLTLEARGGPVGSPDPDITGRLGFRDASLAGLERFLAAKTAVQLDGLLSGDADLHAARSIVTVKGAIEMRKGVVDGHALQYPIILDYDAAHDTRSGIAKLAYLKLTVNNVPILASGEMNTKTSTVDAQVRVTRASMAEVLAAASAFGANGLSGTGVVSLDVRAQGSLEHPGGLNVSGTGALENAVVNTPSLKKPVQIRTANLRFEKDGARLENLVCSLGSSTLRGAMTVRNFSAPEIGFGLQVDKLDLGELQQLTNSGGSSKPGQPASTGALSAKGTLDVGSILYNGIALNHVHSDCVLNRGVLTLSPLTAEVFGGKQSGSITLDTRSQPPVIAMNTKLDSVDANQLLSATTSLKKTLYGLLAAQGDARMALAPGTEAAKTLNGNLNVHLTQGKLTGINLLNEVASLGKFVGYAPKAQPYTDIVQLAGDLAMKDGVASTENMRLQIDGGSVAAAGTVNLVNQALNLRLTTVLDRAMSQKVGGTQIGGFLNTALSNDKGELVIPALVSGTFAQPRFTPDAGRIADMKLKSLLPTSGNPGALTGGILGAIKGQKGSGKSMLDALTGKAAQQPAAAQPAGQQPAQQSQGAASQNAAQKAGGLLGGVLDSLKKKKEQQQAQPKQ